MTFDGLIEIFNPGHRHLREERDRKRIEARLPTSGGPPFGVDLDGGVVRLPRPAAPASADDVHSDTD